MGASFSGGRSQELAPMGRSYTGSYRLTQKQL